MKKIITVFCLIFFITQQAIFAKADNTLWDNYQDILTSAVTVNTFTSIYGEFDHASVDYEKINNKLDTTQLFKWFSKDFESGGYEGVADFVNRFAPERLRNAHQIEKTIKYDWNLNTEQNILKKMKELGTKFPELKLTKK